MKFGATQVAKQDPFNDREPAGMESGRTTHAEQRQEDRNARLATLVVRFADGGDVGGLLRGIARNYMTWLIVTKKVTLNNAACT